MAQETNSISNVAKRVIEKCGGVKQTADLVGRTPSWVYKWTYPKDRSGTGGVVPYDDAAKLLEAAKRGEVDLKPEDFFEQESS